MFCFKGYCLVVDYHDLDLWLTVQNTCHKQIVYSMALPFSPRHARFTIYIMLF